MSDLSNLLWPRTYPEAFGLVHDSFAPQPDTNTCGAAIVRHGLLLGGLLAPVSLLECLLEIRNIKYMGYRTLLKGLERLGFEVEQVSKPKKQSTAAFLDGMRPELEQGAFLLPCLYRDLHWVCLGAWDGKRAWVVDSYYGNNWPREKRRLGFFGYTAEEFDEQEWGNEINVVRPGIWTKQYQAWLPARPALLRMTVKDGPDSPATVEAAVQIAAQQYLNNANYSYRELDLYLPGGVGVTMRVRDPGKNAVLVGEEGKGKDRVLVVRPVLGTLTGQTPPELVLRAGQLHAAQLG